MITLGKNPDKKQSGDQLEFVKANMLEVLLFSSTKPGDAKSTALTAAWLKMTSPCRRTSRLKPSFTTDPDGLDVPGRPRRGCRTALERCLMPVDDEQLELGKNTVW